MTKIREASVRSTKGSSREIHAFESNSKTKLPSLKSQFSLNKRDEGHSSWHLKRQGEEGKRKKRITFDLEDDGVDGEESASQQQDRESVVSGSRRSRGKEGWSNGGDGAATGGGGVRSEGGTEEGYAGGGEATGVGGRDHSGKGEGEDGGDRKGNKGNGKNGNSRDGDNDSLFGGDKIKEAKVKGAAGQGKGQGAAGQRTVFGDKVGGEGGLGTGKGGLATATRSSGVGGEQGAAVLEGGKAGYRPEGQGVGDSDQQGLEGVSGEDGGAQLGFGAHGDGRSGTGGDDATSKQDNTFVTPTDHGKRIRKTGGYMRAVSHTSSEWGDPLHARSFLSSTTASQMGSTSDLTGDTHDISESPPDDPAGTAAGRGRRLLPPIVHPIPPPAVSMHFMTGPEITRPWTFSYH